MQSFMPLSLATFNVKDLFDAADDPESRRRLDEKLTWLAERIAVLDADVVGLQEVGSAAVLEQLAHRIGPNAYPERLVGTADDRGIRNALLSRLPVEGFTVHAPARLDFPVFQAGDPAPFGDRIPMRRGIVHARVKAEGLGIVHVLVAHLKSNRRLFLRAPEATESPLPLPLSLPVPSPSPGASSPRPLLSSREMAEGELRSLIWRSCEALFVRGLVDEVLAASPEAHLAVIGDLNDRPGSLVARTVAGLGPTRLPSAVDLLPEERRFSILHKGRGDLFDHVFVTAGLFAKAVEARLFNDGLRDHGELPDGAPPDPSPDSDHAPLVIRFG